MGLPEGDFDSSLGDEGLALDGRIAEGEACETVESAGDAGRQGMKPGHRGGRENGRISSGEMEFGREIGRRLGAGQRVEPDRKGVRMGVIVSGTFEAEDSHCRTAVEAEQTVEVKAIGE